MDGKKCHRKTPKNHSKPVKFLTVRYKQTWEIMRVKLGFNYGKPFLKYKERPENYKEEFKKN